MNSEIELKQLKKEIKELKKQVALLKGEDENQILNDPIQ
jgi:cell division protein FtsB